MREPPATAPRRTRMRPRLGLTFAPVAALAALLSTAGCGSSSSSTAADDPATSPSSAPTSGPSSPAGAKVHLISLTGAGGGQPTGTASPLNTPDQVAAFSQQFRSPAMAHQIQAYTSRVGSDGDVEGAVIAVGCDRPPGAAVQVDGSGHVTITPYDVESPLQECLVAVTTVAIAVIPQG
jgi:hypothetical protein